MSAKHGHGHPPSPQHAPSPAQPDGHDAQNGNHGHSGGSHGHFDLAEAALTELHDAGFHPEFGPGVPAQLAEIRERLADQKPEAGVEDLRAMGWSSIDNDTSRDLDQIEVAERNPDRSIRLRVAIADVATAVDQGSPIDKHAQDQTQTIYTAVRNFPMLPFDLSTDLTSLNENADRMAITMSFTVTEQGELRDEKVSRAVVRNRAQLAYSRVGPWLENAAKQQVDPNTAELRSDSARSDSPKGIEASSSLANNWLGEQLRIQDEAAQALHKARISNGALEFQRGEAEPVFADGRIKDLHEVTQNRAMHLIEDFMVAANGVMARALRAAGRSGLQRVVRVPQRWDRIVALAAEHGSELPLTPDSVALNNMLRAQREKDPDHYPDVAVSVIKLMGAGEYMLMRADDDPTGHFGLAARDYTHSTAPNRRFPDLVTQRVLHAMMKDEPPPYSDADLAAIATHCNEADKALRKIERAMIKRVAAVALSGRIGESFRAVVTGSSPKGVYARVLQPPFEGRVIRGEDGLDVGDRITVTLLHTDPARAFIDLAKTGH
ncbi:MAG TPA: RNB domain-containing ribonuclease [Acidobacteriaceae bacterium]|jgi:exoribonuclease-2